MDDAPVWSDLTTFDGTAWRGTVDWLIGGIPCQPHSNVGPRTGETDERNLWPDTARIIREVHPRIILLENVEGFKTFYWERVRPELQAMGYSTREGLFSAREVGASQRRRRLFALAYTDSIGWAEGEQKSRVRNNNGSTSSQAVRSRSQMADKPWGELTPSGVDGQRKCPAKWPAKMSLVLLAMITDGSYSTRSRFMGGLRASMYFFAVSRWMPSSRATPRVDNPLRFAF